MCTKSNPLALTSSQTETIEGGNELKPNPSQRAHLQMHGLLADSHETYYAPSGAFILPPAMGTDRRLRLLPNGEVVTVGPTSQKRDRLPSENSRGTLAPSVVTGVRNCAYCETTFEPKRQYDRFCMPVCVSRSRKEGINA